MGKIQKILILVIFISGPLWLKGQQDSLTFREVDMKSFDLYRASQWKDLTGLADRALSQGIDYYYLRIRAGIAWYELNRYARAIVHLRAALEFNENDPVAKEYLFECFLELNRPEDAYKIYQGLPPSSQEKLKINLPMIRAACVEEAYLSCDQADKFDSLDLDGEDNLYGETDLTQDGHYFSAMLKWGFKKGYAVSGAYSFVKVNKDKTAIIGDTLSLDDQYPVRQHQIYLNSTIPAGKGFSVLPAFNLLVGNYETVDPKLTSDSLDYMFPVKNYNYTSYIAYLSVTKDFTILQTTLFAAYSNLNDERQFQGGIQATLYPFGNLNFYLTSKLISHLNEEKNSILFDQLIGVKLVRNTWAAVNATFGHMVNYHENNGFVVYNITDDMKFKGGASLYYFIHPHWTLTGQYLFIIREGKYTYYKKEGRQQAFPVTVSKDFNNHIFLLGLNWKF